MGKRTIVGIPFSYDENWIGGTYYIINLVEALKTLPKKELPRIYFLTRSSKDEETLKELQYPFANFLRLNEKPSGEFFKKILNRLFFNKIPFTYGAKINSIKYVYPVLRDVYSFPKALKIDWIPDFQELHLPYFFSEEELESRRKYNNKLAQYSRAIVFSSEDAKKDFESLFPDSSVKKFVLHFAVTHPDFSSMNIAKIKRKYRVEGKYFFSPNQFWAHKNHKVILEALVFLKNQGKLNFTVLFSGKENDYRNPDYFNSLQNFVSENDLSENVKFLGFIDRKEQLCLMKNAEAIIQPSLFEGWSTVIEDAKAMNQCVIASALGVNKEQLQQFAYYFEPADFQELSEKLLDALKSDKITYRNSYNADILNFARTFAKIIKEVSS